MAKHTNGPWMVECPMGPDIISIVARGDRPAYEWQHVAQVSGTPDDDDDIPAVEAAANARLIAAAPDLLEALKAARTHVITLHPAGDPRKAEPRDMQDGVQIAVLDVIDAALAKAETQEGGA